MALNKQLFSLENVEETENEKSIIDMYKEQKES